MPPSRVVGALTLYGGYELYRQSDPSGRYPSGFTSLGGFDIRPGGIAYVPKVMNVYWTGARYQPVGQVDLAAAFYWQKQNDYSKKACAGTGVYTNSSMLGGDGGPLLPRRLQAAETVRPVRGRDDLQCIRGLG
jgi:hypothetical protein